MSNEQHDRDSRDDGAVLNSERLADRAAIEDLAIAYAHAVDDRDWQRWERLFWPDATIDYRSAGGIAGTPAEVAAWMPAAMAAFEFCLHTTSTHEITFTGDDSALGRAHVFNRNGVRWEGQAELMDVGALYHDVYRRHEGRWRFAERVEQTVYISGGAFAQMVREVAASTESIFGPPFG